MFEVYEKLIYVLLIYFYTSNIATLSAFLGGLLLALQGVGERLEQPRLDLLSTPVGLALLVVEAA